MEQKRRYNLRKRVRKDYKETSRKRRKLNERERYEGEMEVLTESEYNREMKEETNKLTGLFELGDRYEAEVMRKLKEMYPRQMETVMKEKRYPELNDMDETWEYMMRGVPILEQVPFYNKANRTYGVIDLLVRSDWINKIIDEEVLTPEEEVIKAPNLKGNYHYVPIDIKRSTITLRSNGKQICNTGRMAAYKAQLAIYTAGVGQLQGYTSLKAYILPWGWKYTKKKKKHEGYKCFSRLGEIDYGGWDNKYIEETVKAIEWRREVKKEGMDWDIIPPSVPELYPNMCNSYDAPYHKIKKRIARELKEITQVYMIGVKNRTIAHNGEIYKWDDKKCTSKTLNVRGKKTAAIVDAILEGNRSEELISPKKIKSDMGGWKTRRAGELYVDYEAENDCFYDTTINLKYMKKRSGVIFMMGVGYIERGEWKYECFRMEEYTKREEIRIIEEYLKFIERKGKQGIYIYHWGHVERTLLTRANERYGRRWTRRINRINWIDMNKVFKNWREPIVIKGALKFGLKDIANAMRKHGCIESSWTETGVEDGLCAMIKAAEYFKKKARGEVDETIYENIMKYNEIDCKAMWEIVEYLRKNHV